MASQLERFKADVAKWEAAKKQAFAANDVQGARHAMAMLKEARDCVAYLTGA